MDQGEKEVGFQKCAVCDRTEGNGLFELIPIPWVPAIPKTVAVLSNGQRGVRVCMACMIREIERMDQAGLVTQALYWFNEWHQARVQLDRESVNNHRYRVENEQLKRRTDPTKVLEYMSNIMKDESNKHFEMVLRLMETMRQQPEVEIGYEGPHGDSVKIPGAE